MKKRNLYILIGILILVLVGGYLINRKYYTAQKIENFVSPTMSPSSSSSRTPSPIKSNTSNIPLSHLIKNFPFQSQAPLGNWDQLHEESCEEASLILVKYWQGGKGTISAQTMEDEIQKMVAWENSHGFAQDVTVQQVAQIAKDYYGMSEPTPEYNITIADIKKAIADNHPVIIPAAGRLLGNPYFTPPGPIYHMMVIIGYNGNTIIVQDVGTRRGDHYQYNQEILMNAIHDWSGSKENIEQGRKAMLVF